MNLYKNNGTDKITLQTDFEDFEYIMENLDLKMKEFNLLTGAAIEPAADSEKKNPKRNKSKRAERNCSQLFESRFCETT